MDAKLINEEGKSLADEIEDEIGIEFFIDSSTTAFHFILPRSFGIVLVKLNMLNERDRIERLIHDHQKTFRELISQLVLFF